MGAGLKHLYIVVSRFEEAEFSKATILLLGLTKSGKSRIHPLASFHPVKQSGTHELQRNMPSEGDN
jgi:hypothetical protein